MKNLFFLFLTVLVFACCGTSCNPVTTPVDPKPTTYTVEAVVVGGNGAVSPANAIVESGKDITLTLTPNAGYINEKLKIDGAVSTTADVLSYVIYNITSNKKVEVSFKKDSLLFPLLNIVWQVDSLYVYTEADGRMLKFIETNWTQSFSSDGICTEISDGSVVKPKWFLNKNTSPATLIINVTTYKIETLNENKIILSYINGLAKYWVVYSNQRYK